MQVNKELIMNHPWTCFVCCTQKQIQRETTPMNRFLKREWLCLRFMDQCIFADVGKSEDPYQWHQRLTKLLKVEMGKFVRIKRRKLSEEKRTFTVTEDMHSLEVCPPWQSPATHTGPRATRKHSNRLSDEQRMLYSYSWPCFWHIPVCILYNHCF